MDLFSIDVFRAMKTSDFIQTHRMHEPLYNKLSSQNSVASFDLARTMKNIENLKWP